jgi:hypothetical protein
MASDHSTRRPGSRLVDLVGRQFGRLTVVELAPKSPDLARNCWRCRCECGGTIDVIPSRLVSDRVKSCGCLPRPVKRTREQAITHGQTDSPIYLIWRSMIDRCHNPSNHSFASYGGRGIEVDLRWRSSFQVFADDMGPRPTPKHSIDRIDNDRGYGRDNCRWATRAEQAINTRANVWIEFRGERRTLAEWANVLGVSLGTLHNRIKLGWTVERTLTEPLAVKGRAANRPRGEPE